MGPLIIGTFEKWAPALLPLSYRANWDLGVGPFGQLLLFRSFVYNFMLLTN